MPSLADKSVLITGASSGIGAFLARELVRRGARVGLLARREERLRELAEELRADGGQAAWARADVTDQEELYRGLDAVSEELGGADVVVANAGFGRPERPERFKPGRSLATYDVNLLGAIRLFDWAIPRFVDRRSGHIVGVASMASYFGMTYSGSYCGSKAAMRIHLQSLRISLHRHGVAVTTICPGFVKSELTDDNAYHMPFLWKTDRAARKIADGIEKRRREVLFPWQMKLLAMLVVRVLPTALTESLV
ncbi:MAG: SDR family NAD(P)-dependent oxidoreductase, partial [Thermoanaerobaculia bacterium]